MSDIHTSKAKLLENEVELDKAAKSCKPCMTAPETHVAKGTSQYDLCMKCQCQASFDTEDASRDSKVTWRGDPLDCKNCDKADVNKEWCTFQNFLRNDLEVSITDCSNTMLVTGDNNEVNDVKMRTECNVDGADNSAPPVVAEKSFNPTEKKKAKGGFKLSPMMMGGAAAVVVILIIIIASSGGGAPAPRR
jgi:hypothetical protein